jgi:hypothetical protein
MSFSMASPVRPYPMANDHNGPAPEGHQQQYGVKSYIEFSAMSGKAMSGNRSIQDSYSGAALSNTPSTCSLGKACGLSSNADHTRRRGLTLPKRKCSARAAGVAWIAVARQLLSKSHY